MDHAGTSGHFPNDHSAWRASELPHTSTTGTTEAGHSSSQRGRQERMCELASDDTYSSHKDAVLFVELLCMHDLHMQLHTLAKLTAVVGLSSSAIDKRRRHVNACEDIPWWYVALDARSKRHELHLLTQSKLLACVHAVFREDRHDCNAVQIDALEAQLDAVMLRVVRKMRHGY